MDSEQKHAVWQPGFFDIDDRLKRLSDLGDQLETFRSAVDFELFRPELNAALSCNNAKSKIRARVEHGVRGAKGSDGAIHQNYRDRPSNDQDRNGQSRLQPPTLYLPAQDRHCMTGLGYARRPFESLLNCDQAKSVAGVRGAPSR
jgi:hypothetical protein